MNKPSFPWLEILAAGGGVGILWFLMFRNGGHDNGLSLWPALGYPYGPVGNLPAMGAFTRTGNLSGALPGGGAVPTYLSPTNILTDQEGNWLYNQRYMPLTNQGGQIGPIFPAHNPNGLRVSIIPSGSRPS